MANLETKTNMCTLIVEGYNTKGVAHIFNEDLMDMQPFYYYMIKHDKDIDNETGELKHVHYHIVISSLVRHQLSWFINRICEVFKCNVNAVQIDVVNSMASSIQYLTHKNNSDKHQYDINLIHTNHYQSFLNYYTEPLENKQQLTIGYLRELYDKHRGRKLDIIKELGIGTYHSYRNTINDILEAFFKEDRERFIEEGIKLSNTSK